MGFQIQIDRYWPAMVIDVVAPNVSHFTKKEYETLEKYQGPKEGTEDNVENKGQSSSVIIGALRAVTPKLGLGYNNHITALCPEECSDRNS